MSTHLLPDERARALERAAGLAEWLQELRDTPYWSFLDPAAETAAALELAVTRSLAERMSLLARWAGPDGGALVPIFIEQDAHNVRDVLRGLAGGLAPERRIANAIPTPSLGRKELEALAHAESAGAVAATLTEWEHPLGSALLDEAGRSQTDLFRLEAALARRAASSSARAARKGGRRMRSFVRESIDAGNAVTAVLLAGARAEGEPTDYFVEGGENLPPDAFARAASAPDRAAALEALAAAAEGTALGRTLREPLHRPSALSNRILSARIDAYAKRSLQEPVTAVPVLLFVLRLRREAQLVRRALWTAALRGARTP
jgi:V/A-type H+-transporting ATPase subunit C